VQGLIALGGMGAVYRVKDRATGQTLALKRLNRDALVDPRAIESFEREYQVLAGLSHPRIIRVFDYGRDAEGPYYTMELVDGMDMAEAAPLPYKRCCHYLRDVAASLALLHARRLVHRDVSAANVRATAAGRCKLLDFGTLSPFGHSGVVAGTPPFIAPEALRGGSLDHRADLFALGALAYWMLTGHHAFPAQRLEDLSPLWRIPPAPPSQLASKVPKELDALVLSLLSLDPLARRARRAPPRSSRCSRRSATSRRKTPPRRSGSRRASSRFRASWGESRRWPSSSRGSTAPAKARERRCASRPSPAWAVRACSKSSCCALR
jgi:serine/threonine-protein kinase